LIKSNGFLKKILPVQSLRQTSFPFFFFTGFSILQETFRFIGRRAAPELPAFWNRLD